jgi:hypothetical protein
MKKILSILLLLAFVNIINAQSVSDKCGTMHSLDEAILKNPSVKTIMDAAELDLQKVNTSYSEKTAKATRANIIKIPVVVHVIYKTTQQNITAAQINSQIARLNLDFRLHNADSLPVGHPFWNYSNDAEIEFCLAQTDPNGNFTTGITRTVTSVTAFDDVSTTMANVKRTALGGKDNWDPNKYLNIWVCNIGSASSVLGYAAFPWLLQTDPNSDGVVIRYTAFGNNVGFLASNTKLGRTATHEIGHWLSLRHIWGDAFCGDDFVADTREAEDKNFNCPTFPHNAFNGCGEDGNGEMYMDFMDYVDDDCMNTFTTGQCNRMRQAIVDYRPGLLNSTKCNFPASIVNTNITNSMEIYPNPSSGMFIIESPVYNLAGSSMHITNALGATLMSVKDVNNFPYTLNLTSLAEGLYYININNGKYNAIKKIFISK